MISHKWTYFEFGHGMVFFIKNPAHISIEFIQLVTFEFKCSELNVFPFEKLNLYLFF